MLINGDTRTCARSAPEAHQRDGESPLRVGEHLNVTVAPHPDPRLLSVLGPQVRPIVEEATRGRADG